MNLVEHIEEQDDLALVDKAYRETGLDLLNEEQFDDDDLEFIAENPERFYEGLFDMFTPHAALAKAAGAKKVADRAQSELARVRAGNAAAKLHPDVGPTPIAATPVTHAPVAPHATLTGPSPDALTHGTNAGVHAAGTTAMTQAPGTTGGQVQNIAHHAQQGFHNYVQPGLQSVGHVVGGAAQGAAKALGHGQGIAGAIAAHPTIAGAAALGLGAMAALRMRKAAKNRAQMRAMGR
jgi:hypothetical protein